MSENYVLFSFATTGAGDSHDLSPFFNTAGSANSSYQNGTWQLVDSNYPYNNFLNGPINPDGSLGGLPGFSAPFVFTDNTGYPASMQLQITFTPDPCKNCPPDSTGTAPGPSTPDSVELATGRFVFFKKLMSLAGSGGQDWEFDLNYKANYDVDGILGKNFAYPQYMHLEQLGTFRPYTNIQLVTNELTRAIFDDAGSGNYNPGVNNNSGCTLSFTGSGSTGRFTLRAANGTVTTFFGFDSSFPAPGQVESIVDRHGNSQTMTWGSDDGIPQLLTVTDAYGRVISYSYYGSEGGYHLKQLTDYLGRQLNFQYDAYDRLVAVVTPSILKAASGNTFPGGTAYVFQYDIDNANPVRRDDLIRIWYPNQTQPYLDVATRTVDVAAVYENAAPRYQVTYGQNLSDVNTYGKVLTETLGDPVNEAGGTATFGYVTTGLPTNIIDGSATIVSRTVYTDRNGNRTLYDFNANRTVSRLEVDLNRNKNSLEVNNLNNGGVKQPPFVTWTQYNGQNQPLLVVYPEGNSTQYTYETGVIAGLPNPYVARRGLLLSESRLPGNTLSLPARSGSGGQTILTKRYFYEPLFGQLCAIIDERGNPVDGSTYYTPQNGGTTPTNSDRSRYATLYTFDYQKDALATISGDTNLQALLKLSSSQIQTLIASVDTDMKKTTGTGGIPAGFPVNLGDINGDGTGNGATSGLPQATHLGNCIRVVRPAVRLVGGTSQSRIELRTVNDRGQVTTATDAEGNLTITTRYPENDPEGTGQYISASLSTQQYGLVREIHRDANPDDVMSLVGASGDLAAYNYTVIGTTIPRTNTPGIYQNLVTRFEGSSGCATCAYDPMGNVLNETDPRGFTTIYDRNEVGEVYRQTSPAPYSFRVETSYDANRNVIQVDTEDRQVQYNSPDPTSAGYGTFTPTGSGTTAHVPMIAGPGGQLRPGWFSTLMSYDMLNNKIEEDVDAAGSVPGTLLTRFQYDSNRNLTKIIKPEGNTVEYDYDERNLRIVERVGYNPANPVAEPGAVTVYSYDGNKNLLNVIGPVDHNSSSTPSGTSLTANIGEAFGGSSTLNHFGDWILQNIYDGFNRVVQTVDAIGNAKFLTYDPTSALIQNQAKGPIGGVSRTSHSQVGNVVLSNDVIRFDEARRPYEYQKDVLMASGAYPLDSARAVTHTGGGLATNSNANDHTGLVTLTTGGSSYVLARTIYDRAGRVASVLSDNTASTTYAYDGANRRILSTDPLANTVATQYDANGNATQTTRTDVCTITAPTVEDEVFVSFTWYDSLNRPVVTGNQGADGNLTNDLALCCPWQGLPSTLFSLTGYDSRGNQVTVTDPKGNVVVTVFDGASRQVETQQEMRLNGDGRNAPAPNQTFLAAGGGVIRTEYVYDGNSRLIELVDDRGASTVYTYDALNRQVTKTLADGSHSTKTFDLSGCLKVFTDENGSVRTMTFDAMCRNIYIAIAPAAGVIGTGAQSFQYDGLSRMTQAIDSSSYDVEVDLTYDSLGRTLEDTQGYGGLYWYTTQTAYTSYPVTQLTYPSGDITATNTYDALYRRTSLAGASATHGTLDTVDWQFFGARRVVETSFGSGSLIATQMNNNRTHSAVQSDVPLPEWGGISSDQLGYDGAGRMISKRYLTGGINGTTHAYTNPTSLVGHTAAFDRNGNKLYERHLESESRSELYQPFNSDGSFAPGYDSANRLTQYQRGILSDAIIPYRVNPGASITTQTTLPGANQVRTYGLDGLGNWKTGNFTLVGSGGTTTDTAELRQHNYVNEITSVRDTTAGTPTTVSFTYDYGNNTNHLQGNGNLANDGIRSYAYDVFNRLTQVNKVAGDIPIATYMYDALNRRVQKTVMDLGSGLGGLTGDIPAGTVMYLYDGEQIIEEREFASYTDWTRLCFWGRYIDELLFFTVPTATTYRVMSDLLYRSVGTTTTSNVVTEAYDCDAYGNTLCYSGAGTDTLWFTNDDVRTNNPKNCTIYTGRQYDPETQIYYYRARYYSPVIGRFISRDIPPAPKLNKVPNLYEYVLSNPVNRLDPTGLDPCDDLLAQIVADTDEINQLSQKLAADRQYLARMALAYDAAAGAFAITTLLAGAACAGAILTGGAAVLVCAKALAAEVVAGIGLYAAKLGVDSAQNALHADQQLYNQAQQRLARDVDDYLKCKKDHEPPPSNCPVPPPPPELFDRMP